MHPLSTRVFGLSIAGLALLLVYGPVWAGESSPGQSAETVALQLEVSKDGKPVRGLTADDFLVRDKGKTVQMVDVLEVTTDPGTEGLPDIACRQFLFLFDLEFTAAKVVVRATELAEAMVSRSLLPVDRVAIVTHDSASGLGVVLTPTSDRAEIGRALGSLRAQQMALIGGPPSAGPIVNADSLISARVQNTESAKGIVQQAQGQIRKLIGSLSRLEQMARSVPGGSQVVLFSEGFDSSVILGNDLTARRDQAIETQQSEASARGEIWAVNDTSRFGGGVVETDLFEMLSDYKRSGVRIQSVQLRSEGDARPVSRGSQGPNGLLILSEKTGGRVVSDIDDPVRQMSAVLQPAGSTYLLTFAPQSSKTAGRYRRVDVTLTNPVEGTTLVAPPGYYEP